MIESMYFVTVTGPKEDLERVTDQYLSQYSVQLENALTVLRGNKKLLPFTDADPYHEIYAKSESLKEDFRATDSLPADSPLPRLSSGEAVKIVQDLERLVQGPKEQRAALLQEKQETEEKLSLIEQFTGLNYDLSTILHFQFLQFRFGRIAHEHYEEMMEYLNSRDDSIFSTCRSYEDYVWGVYFVPKSISARVDAVYASMHFERFYLPDVFDGTPQEASAALRKRLREIEQKLEESEQELRALLNEKRAAFTAANRLLEQKTRFFGVRRLAACYSHNRETYYILCGWMPQKDALALRKELDPDPQTYCVIEKDRPDLSQPPPTRLKNIPLFRPFELFVEMYGLPNYREMDPTALLALSYSLFFGFMFGDLGQGLCLALLGAAVSRRTGSRLGGIIARCGLSSAVFGLLFGSVFGFEDVIPALWLRPAEALMRLPGIGKLNTVFLIAVLTGMLMILLMMGFGIVNRIRMREPGEACFGSSGLSGMIFYLGIFAALLSLLSGHALPGGAARPFFFALPLILIFLKEPLTELLGNGKARIRIDRPAMFAVQGFFELFEVLLSYFSNTLSFVRIGAFAVSHASMMGVVLMLAGAESGNISWPGILLGNIFVCAMEGLIVGIQVLRLEYYELFSRFYRGDGRPFEPYDLTQAQ